MKVAIITLFGNFNYGNRLQNYALHTVLERDGHAVRTIWADTNTSAIKRYLKKYIERSKKFYHLKRLKEITREKAFDRFTERNIPTHLFHTKDGKIPLSVNEEYDAFIVGSDQVWNPLFWRDSDDSSELYNFFLGFSELRNISYAASFGIDAVPERWKQRMQPLLKKFDYVSVREKSGCEITGMLGVQSEVALDPTLLLRADDWRKIEEGVVKEKGFILTYFLGEEQRSVVEEIERVSKRRNLKVINLYDEKSQFYRCGPEVFLELIDKAEIVYTDSFHATVFSMIFHTTFAVFNRNHANRSDMSSRIRTLLEIAGIGDGISDSRIVYNQEFPQYDKRLDTEREKSLSFIRNALATSGMSC